MNVDKGQYVQVYPAREDADGPGVVLKVKDGTATVYCLLDGKIRSIPVDDLREPTELFRTGVRALLTAGVFGPPCARCGHPLHEHGEGGGEPCRHCGCGGFVR